MFTFSNAPLDDDDKDMEMFYFMTALDARLCSVKKESCCSTSQLVTTRVSAFIYWPIFAIRILYPPNWFTKIMFS